MPKNIFLPCGSSAFFDHNSGISYRCEGCGMVVGSVGMPDECKQEAEKWDAWQKLGGSGWDYVNGGPEKVKQRA